MSGLKDIRFEWQRWIRDDEELSSSTKLFAFVLITYVGKVGTAFPSNETLARGMGFKNAASVKTHRQELERRGYIKYTAPGVGRKGSYKIARPPEKLTLQDVTQSPAPTALADIPQSMGDIAECRQVTLQDAVEQRNEQPTKNNGVLRDVESTQGALLQPAISPPTSVTESLVTNHSVTTTSPVATERGKVATPKPLPWAREILTDAKRKPQVGELYVLDLDGVGGKPLTAGEAGLFGENEEAPDDLLALHEPTTRERRTVGTP